VVRGTWGGEAGIATRKPGGWKPIVVLVLLVAAFNYVWMPADFIAGDPTAWREETRSLLLRSELNVPAGYAQGLGEPGQYFVRNERNGLYYSKYGLANALFALPPMWLQQATGGDVTTVGRLPSLFLFNVWYVLLSAVLAGLLYVLSGAYSTNVGSRVLYVAWRPVLHVHVVLPACAELGALSGHPVHRVLHGAYSVPATPRRARTARPGFAGMVVPRARLGMRRPSHPDPREPTGSCCRWWCCSVHMRLSARRRRPGSPARRMGSRLRCLSRPF
jgi:hypothetical protein